jgi:hypothetical protein
MATFAIKQSCDEFSSLLESSSPFSLTPLSFECQFHDYLVLLEFDYFNQSYSGRSLVAEITSVKPCKQLNMEHCVEIGFSFLASDLLNN